MNANLATANIPTNFLIAKTVISNLATVSATTAHANTVMQILGIIMHFCTCSSYLLCLSLDSSSLL